MVRVPLDKLEDNEFVKAVSDRVDDILDSVEYLTKCHVFVGVPEANNNRGEGESIGNAALAYVHNYGSERANIPPRPFLEPGIDRSQDLITEQFAEAAKAALNGNKQKVEMHLVKAGSDTAENIKNVIEEGIPPPLKVRTVAGRRRQRGKDAGIRRSEIFYAEQARILTRQYNRAYAEAYLFETKFELQRTQKIVHTRDMQRFRETFEFVANEAGARLATPLINTGKLLASISWVITHDE